MIERTSTTVLFLRIQHLVGNEITIGDFYGALGT